MPKRTQREELEFGSDSFLDIVANMVGILIILIVVAGVRVSQNAALPLPEEIAEEEVEFITELPIIGTSDAPLWIESQPLPPLMASEEPEAVIVDLTPPDQPELRERHRQQLVLLQQAEAERLRLANSLLAVRGNRERASQQFSSAQTTLTDVEQQVESKRTAFDSAKTQLAEKLTQKDASEKLLAQLRQQADNAREMLAATPVAEQTGEVLRHDLTPVSEMIQGKELHFHVRNGRVALVPIEAMMTRIRDQIENKKDWLLKSNSVHGNVGPVEGFRMKYLIQRESLTPLEELRMGSGMVRIGLREWTIEPDETLQAESLDEVRLPTSRFALALRAASLDTTCTFWVYPDSFDEFQELQKLVHQHNLRIAGRPLPEGVPITGSPNGSRSAAQ